MSPSPAAMASSSWGTKLQTKLSSIVETSSRESIQTLAKWIGFNRKYADAFALTLRDALVRSNGGRQVAMVTLVHEILMLESGSSKWDKLEEMRIKIGEETILPALEHLQPAARTKLAEHLKEWDFCFSGPTLLGQIKKKIQLATSPGTPNDTSDSTLQALPQPSTAQPAVELTAGPEAPPVAAKTEPGTALDELEHDIVVQPKIVSQPSEVLSYDFEASGIPAAKVDPKDFLEPCRQIATLQIARDIRNDGAVQLSSLFSSLPADVKAFLDSKDSASLPLEQARDFSIRINEFLIDMDMEEQLQNIDVFKEIIQRQHVARERLINLLIQSRCDFGANEAAAAFEQSSRATGDVATRHRILLDAMELEGIEVDETENPPEHELPPLRWYNNFSEPDTKRARTE